MSDFDDVRAQVVELSRAYSRRPSTDALEAIAAYLPELQDEPATFYELASALARQVFYYGQYFAKPGRDRLFFDKIGAPYIRAIRRWRQRLVEIGGHKLRAAPTSPIVWIVTAQYLGPLHAPTKRVLRVAKQLERDGFKPRIINANGLSYKITINVLDNMVSERRKAPSGWGLVREKEHYWPIWTPSVDDLGDAKFAEIAAEFASEPPRATFQIGDLNAVSDLIAGFAPTISVPTTFRQQITTAHALMELQPIGEWHEIGDQPEPIRFRTRLEQNAEAFHPPVSRADLGIPDDVPLMVLPGTRLEGEVAPIFEQSLSMILEAIPHAWLLICSWDREYPFKSDHLRLRRDRIVRVHSRPDIRQIIACCDLLIDPPGLGGGACARFAKEEGVPALALAGGDAAAVLGSDHTVVGFDQLIKTGYGWLSGGITPPPYPEQEALPLLDSAFAIAEAEQSFYR
jgi:hypothetical protein